MFARCLLQALAIGLTLLAALPAAAQNAVTLFGGYAWGGALQQTGSAKPASDLDACGAGAASIDWVLDAARKLQLFASGQRTTLPLPAGSPSSLPISVVYVHVGGSNFFDGTAGRGGYVAGGVGATFMSPGLSGLSAEVRPSMSLAIGYEHPLNPSLALRAELRGYATAINSSGGLFCSGGCMASLQGDALFQGEALFGPSLRF